MPVPDCLDTEVEQHVSTEIREWKQARLSSAFQPIYSLAHGREVGFEALLRGMHPEDGTLLPPDLFRRAASTEQAHELDDLSCGLHVANFARLRCRERWLFLNIQLDTFLHREALLGRMAARLQALGIDTHQVVLEILETPVSDPQALIDAAALFREHGFLIAVDDFGAGHSNIDRLWSLHPDIVKLDRSLLAAARQRGAVGRVLPGMVSLLHETSALVLVEGVESSLDAVIAMDSGADLVQGYYFARPVPAGSPMPDERALMSRLLTDYREYAGLELEANRFRLAPYLEAFDHVITALKSGMSLEDAGSFFLLRSHAARCFLLDRDGFQIGDNAIAPSRRAVRQLQLRPLADVRQASWSHRSYFRRALEHPGRVQISRPYLSLTGANHCVTLSVLLTLDGRPVVLCGDVDWEYD